MAELKVLHNLYKQKWCKTYSTQKQRTAHSMKTKVINFYGGPGLVKVLRRMIILQNEYGWIQC